MSLWGAEKEKDLVLLFRLETSFKVLNDTDTDDLMDFLPDKY